MGNNVWSIEMTEKGRLFKEYLSLDLVENIHLHIKDLRVEFSIKEWEIFTNFIKEADSWRMGFGDYKEGVEDHKILSKVIEVPVENEYFDGRIRLERQNDDEVYHLHFHNYRFHFPKGVMMVLSNIFSEEKKYKVHCVKDILIHVFNGNDKSCKLSPLPESPVYKGLFDDFVSYKSYIDSIIRLDPYQAHLPSVEGYRKLLENITKNGFDFNMGIGKLGKVRIENGVLVDGQHRCCILMKIHGENAKLIFYENYLVGMKI